jgi:putative transposase
MSAQKNAAAFAVAQAGRFPVRAVAETLGVARSNLTERLKPDPPKRRGRPAQPDDRLISQIKAVIAELPTYGYRRVHAILRRRARINGAAAPNHKRVWRVMKEHGLLLQRHAGGEERRHEGQIAVSERNRRWCSDGFEIGCDNGDRVCVAFALELLRSGGHELVATIRRHRWRSRADLILAAVEHRFGNIEKVPAAIEWLSDNGSCYVARNTKQFARGIGLEPITTPFESPESNGMAEAFVRTFKRDYVRISFLPDAQTVLGKLPGWFAHYNEVHPHKALGYRSPAEFIRATLETLWVDVSSVHRTVSDSSMHCIGELRTEQLDIATAQLRMRVTRRPRYTCRSCEGPSSPGRRRGRSTAACRPRR